MHRYRDRSSDAGLLPSRPFCPGCIISTRGYDFREGQECIVHHLGLALGGRRVVSFAKRLMLPVSNDTLLRVVRRRARPRTEPPNVVGIDDLAFRRNRRYGTIVCDLERRRGFSTRREECPILIQNSKSQEILEFFRHSEF